MKLLKKRLHRLPVVLTQELLDKVVHHDVDIFVFYEIQHTICLRVDGLIVDNVYVDIKERIK